MELLKSLKILVVDDMLTMRKVVGKELRKLGATDIVEAEDGVAAWAKIEEAVAANTPFQMIISDWNMPKMMGVDLLKKVRANPKVSTVAFLLVTAESDLVQVKEAVHAGVDNYLVKPFNSEMFNEKITVVLNKRFKK